MAQPRTVAPLNPLVGDSQQWMPIPPPQVLDIQTEDAWQQMQVVSQQHPTPMIKQVLQSADIFWGLIQRGAVACGVLAFITTPAPVLAANRLDFISSPTSYVGAGRSISLSPEHGVDVKAENFGFGPSFAFVVADNYRSTPNPQDWQQWSLKLAPPWGQTLTTGPYQNAAGSTSFDVPGILFSGDGGGAGMVRGSFDLLELKYRDSGAIASLAVDFLQFDGGAMTDWIKGAIRFNSDLPIALIPEAEPPGFDAPEHAPPRSDAPLSGIIPLIPDHPGSDMAGSDLTPPQDDVQRNELIAFNPGADDWAAESDAWIWFSSGSAATMVDLPISTAIFAQTADVPGPLPVAAAVAGWRWSRRLRDRCGRRAALPSR